LTLAKEWQSVDTFPTRVGMIETGINGFDFRKQGNPPTVFDENGAVDKVKGGNGRDWFLHFAGGQGSSDIELTL
jgi:hypothetical protein